MRSSRVVRLDENGLRKLVRTLLRENDIADKWFAANLNRGTYEEYQAHMAAHKQLSTNRRQWTWSTEAQEIEKAWASFLEEAVRNRTYRGLEPQPQLASALTGFFNDNKAALTRLVEMGANGSLDIVMSLLAIVVHKNHRDLPMNDALNKSGDDGEFTKNLMRNLDRILGVETDLNA